MMEYEIVVRGAITEAYVFRFDVLEDAMKQAALLSRKFSVDVSVVRVVGTYSCDPRWVPFEKQGGEVIGETADSVTSIPNPDNRESGSQLWSLRDWCSGQALHSVVASD